MRIYLRPVGECYYRLTLNHKYALQCNAFLELSYLEYICSLFFIIIVCIPIDTLHKQSLVSLSFSAERVYTLPLAVYSAV